MPCRAGEADLGGCSRGMIQLREDIARVCTLFDEEKLAVLRGGGGLSCRGRGLVPRRRRRKRVQCPARDGACNASERRGKRRRFAVAPKVKVT